MYFNYDIDHIQIHTLLHIHTHTREHVYTFRLRKCNYHCQITCALSLGTPTAPISSKINARKNTHSPGGGKNQKHIIRPHRAVPVRRCQPHLCNNDVTRPRNNRNRHRTTTDTTQHKKQTKTPINPITRSQQTTKPGGISDAPATRTK